MAKLIKPVDDPKSAPEGLKLNLFDLESQAQMLMHAARREAALLLKRSQEEAHANAKEVMQSITHESRKQGYAQGMEEGRKAAFEQVKKDLSEKAAPMIALLEKVLNGIEAQREVIRKRAIAEVLDLAFQVADLVVKARIEVDPETIVRNVEAAIDLTLDRTNIEVAVNPDDMQLIEDYLKEIQEHFSEVENANLVGDEKIQRGGCIISTPSGSVDARIDTQLNELRHQLLRGS